MGLLLIIDQFLLPAFVIENDRFFSRIERLIKEIRNQNMNLAVTDPLGLSIELFAQDVAAWEEGTKRLLIAA